ncbi:helix-turn-helix domain-containing protein [Pseudoflavonifractor phocaeensis]|uniref:helix-turn-helix domain-containing protein n=1 Tax=Pseudoflavonifractor phocaeensis TaxID=1870988 RepID=UPI00195650F8|nr:helix-turn-helix domain-containing protein [Pseudoflavonifractor phocaeensis]MBM6937375.1 helix-turn-helix domain-containing protein [Pseudoflavonifractor phocaeensis]
MSQPDQIDLTAEEKSYLQALIDAKKVPPRVSDRAKILLLRSDGVSPSEIHRRLHIQSKSVQLCLDKFRSDGLMRALQDDQRSGHPKEISEEAMQWIVQTAKKSPRTLGYEQDLWSIALLHQYVQQHAKEAGFPRLERITSPTVSRIVNQADRQNLKVRKTRKLNGFNLINCTEVLIYCRTYPRYKNGSDGVRIIGCDVVTAEIFVSEPKSALQVSCIQLLELLDGRYPETYTIRIIDDDCRVFKSPEIQLYIWGKRKGRFEVYTLPTEEKYAEKLLSVSS